MTVTLTHREPGGTEGFAGIPRYVEDHRRVFPDLESMIVPGEPNGLWPKFPYLRRRWRQDGLGATHALAIGDALGTPAVVTVHDLYAWTLREHFREWGGGRRYPLYWLLQCRQALKARHRVAFSPEAVRELEAVNAPATETIRPLTPGPYRVPPLTGHRRSGFLTVGDNSPRKGHEAALQAARSASDSGGHESCMWVGTEWQFEPHATYSGHLRGLGMPAAVRLTETDLVQEYQNRRALVVGSWAEGWCYPVQEALSQGCPVVHVQIPHRATPADAWFKTCWPGLPSVSHPSEVKDAARYDARAEYDRLSDKYSLEDDDRYREQYQRIYDDCQ